MIVVGGLLPSVGGGKGVITGDLIGAFVVGLPLAIFLESHTSLGVWGVCIARALNEIAKVLIFEWRRSRISWARLAREHQGKDLEAAH